ncbi:nitrate/nitrite transporter [Maribacter chungangensis]|uniref:Nitrate/nitrite transporter n=1 Tax=Maribacter chungangensis TaxID=1069117 RepID=A0ABW3B3A9_9FLAO
MKQKSYILPVIILSQFACTSPWFAGNSIINELISKTGLGTELLGYVISSVQFGFITGTLVFALFMLADRYSPSRVFLVCALLAAACNMYLLAESITGWGLLLARFGTGFFLAGIYPVGMKIAADYYEKGLGKALGFLVGALVLGTAFPFLLNGTEFGNDPRLIIATTSVLTVFGGLLLFLFVPNGPFRKKSSELQLSAGFQLFKIPGFRRAAFGYFGHMWELYAFWAFTPFAIQSFNQLTSNQVSVPLWTGIVITLGAISCALGGLLSQRYGSKKVAFTSLLLSGICCLASPLLFQCNSVLFLGGWCIWGMAVTADSPQFSNLVASAVDAQVKGTALTLVNCIGFAITIASIQLLASLTTVLPAPLCFLILALGPLVGLWQLSGHKND